MIKSIRTLKISNGRVESEVEVLAEYGVLAVTLTRVEDLSRYKGKYTVTHLPTTIRVRTFKLIGDAKKAAAAWSKLPLWDFEGLANYPPQAKIKRIKETLEVTEWWAKSS